MGSLIIEKITGKKWQTVVKERIFTPANMPTSKILTVLTGKWCGPWISEIPGLVH